MRSGSPRCLTPAPRAHSGPGSHTSSWSTAPISSTPPAASGCRCRGVLAANLHLHRPNVRPQPEQTTRRDLRSGIPCSRGRHGTCPQPTSRRAGTTSPRLARGLGIPRHVFVKSPLERKPMYLDTDSPVLGRILCRHARHAASESSQHRIRFTEMPHTRADVATRRRWQSVRLRAAARRARHARVKLPAAQQLIEENDPSATSHVPTAAWRARRTRRYQRGHDRLSGSGQLSTTPGCVDQRAGTKALGRPPVCRPTSGDAGTAA